MNKQIFFLILVFYTVFVPIQQAQSPYNLSSRVDGPLLGGGAVLFTSSIIIDVKSRPFYVEDQLRLSPEQLNFIDKIDHKVLQRWDKKADSKSDKFLSSSLLFPIAAPLLAGNNSRHKMGVTYLIVFEGMLINAGLTNLTKVLAKRPRPYAYNQINGELIPEDLLYSRETLRSFFSGHTSIVASNTFMAAKMLDDFYPDNDAKPYYWATAALIPAITGYLRVKAGKHFITDVLVGFAVGATVGWVVPELHK